MTGSKFSAVLTEVRSLRSDIQAGFTAINQRIDSVHERIDSVNTRWTPSSTQSPGCAASSISTPHE
jgi:hypothetical protein